MGDHFSRQCDPTVVPGSIVAPVGCCVLERLVTSRRVVNELEVVAVRTEQKVGSVHTLAAPYFVTI